MAFTKQYLSGSTTGKGIKIAQTATPGTLLHTADATAKDEVWVFVQNSDTTARKLTIEFGGVAVPDDLMEVTVPAESGLLCVIPGLVLGNSLVVRAWAATANVLVAYGFVNRVS